MKVARALMFAALAGLVGTSLDAAQGPKPGRGPARVHVAGAKGTPQGPKANRPSQRPTKDPSTRAVRNAKPETIADGISKNPQLESRLKAMLPSDMTLAQASDGFRNQGQFIAALEASKNHNIPFKDLKAAMTGDDALSLGQAIKKLRPSADTADAD